MRQADLFEAKPTHYGPHRSADTSIGGRMRCVALCGVEYQVGGEVQGSSNLANVTCPRCLEEAKR